MKFINFLQVSSRTDGYAQVLYLKDENDNMFVELAVTSNSKYLVTSNTRDFQHSDLIFKGFQLITPAEFVKEWRRNNG